MTTIKYKLLTPTAKAPTMSFDGSDNTMGIDVFTDADYQLLRGEYSDLVRRCNNYVKFEGCGCHPHASILPYANIKTGVALELPPGVHLSWGGRSGLAFKDGVIAFEGKIDRNYKGELAVKIWTMNPDEESVIIPAGTKIAQLYIINYTTQYNIEETLTLTASLRGEHGFGSSGSR